jgi:hypothetical protein
MRLRWTQNIARMGENRNTYRLWVSKPEEKRPLPRYRRRWEDNIQTDLREQLCPGIDRIHQAQVGNQLGALVNTTMNFRVL